MKGCKASTYLLACFLTLAITNNKDAYFNQMQPVTNFSSSAELHIGNCR